MNAKQVLSKVAKLLNLEAEEVALTYAKLADGTIVESKTFDVGEELLVVSEDGTKTPAPDGTHELSLKDESGNENLIKVKTEGGKIVERENVELADADAEKVKETPLPGDPSEVNDAKTEGNENVTFPPKGGTSSMMSQVDLAVVPGPDGPLGAHPETDSVEPLPTTEDGAEEEDGEGEAEVEINLESLAKQCMELSYRITELEKQLKPVEEEVSKDAEVSKESDVELEEEELPKLDGAPVEMSATFTPEEISKRFGKKVQNTQNSFLSKLYR